MPRLVDLTASMDPKYRDLVPKEFARWENIVSPKISYWTPDKEGKEVMMKMYGAPEEDLPDGEGYAAEMLHEMSSHCGTHVDAPLHSGRLIEGRPARTMSDIDLAELFRPGLVLDVRPWVNRNEAISIEALQRAIDATGQSVEEGHAVLLRTGQEEYANDQREFYEYPGMTGDGTRFLTGLGATILGTDALAWDRPTPVLVEAYKRTGDKGHIWDGHFAIRDKEAFIVQKLTNLKALPLSGFTVGFFPIKLPRTSAAPCRAVAFIAD
ncbi:cyclase family protein [Streptomyces mirabilis]|uniref:cyclase family protein n=1 Tax=Streptomyces mirabilis TaxID=68239 RepID=UPI0036CECF83